METKNCQNCKVDFVIEQDDFNFYEKIKVPAPSWCPRCRFLRKISFLNERSLYKRNCDLCGISNVSMYHPDTDVSIYCLDCHTSDKWSGLDYGQNFDFSKTFFEQFLELRNKVPHKALDKNSNTINCDYANFCFDSKNVYLSFDVLRGENIKYSKHLFKDCKDCLDCLICKKNDHCYENIQSSYNYNSSFLIESEQCIESHFLFDCNNCVNCCMSNNLRNKSNVFCNKQLTKEEYQKEILSLDLDTYSGQLNAKKEFKKITKNVIRRYAHIKNCVNSSGDFIENTKNCFHSYGLVGAENVKNSFLSMSLAKDSQDLILTGTAEECYEMIHGGGGINRVLFSFRCGSSSYNLFYCEYCKYCSNCFGCVGLEKKEYCILNKQYTKEQYEELLPQIIKHMNEMLYVDKSGLIYPFGEYFSTELSPFAYNETLAFEENPLTKEEAQKLGYKWLDKEEKIYDTTIESNQIADNIKDVPEKICDEVITCPNKGKTETLCTFGYKILPDELSFYRQMNLPIPRYCPNCRYYERLKWTNPFVFYQRECMCNLKGHNHQDKCQNKFETMYAPHRPEIIFCKDCYQKEIY